MTWLVDTNIISELCKGPRCHRGVASWWAAADERDLHLSALTLGEIRKGIEALRPRDPIQAQALTVWLDAVRTGFGARVLGVDGAVAETWGRLSARRKVPVIDTLLAATALVHDLVLVTRNTRDVADSGARILNPFAA